jgi:MinD-like ATPase involved in chromosome partitioning or flagellar assembly
MDQADKLRKLIRTAEDSPRDVIAPLPMVVVSGARPGVGATTVAVNLAAALADGGGRVLLVDADEHANMLADLAGVAREIEHTVDDVLAGKCPITDAIVSGPVGVQVLANHRLGRSAVRPEFKALAASTLARNSQAASDSSRIGLQRLLGGLESLRDDVDLVVVDAGSGLTPSTQRLWLRAQLVALVTTAEDAAVVDAYATLKRSASDGIRPAIRLLVNQAEIEQVADDVCRRAQQACRRFLSLPLEALPPLPADENAADGFGSLRIWESPQTAFGRAMLWVGKGVRDFMASNGNSASDREYPAGKNSELLSNVR